MSNYNLCVIQLSGATMQAPIDHYFIFHAIFLWILKSWYLVPEMWSPALHVLLLEQIVRNLLVDWPDSSRVFIILSS